MIKFPFVLGVGVGYVLGARAGRNRYEQIVRAAKRTKESPAVAHAADAVASRGEDALKAAKDKVAEKAPDWVPGSTKSDSEHPKVSVPNGSVPGTAPSLH